MSVDILWRNIQGIVKREDIKVVLDLGCYDLSESIYLSNLFINAKTYSFECCPEVVKIAKERLEKNKYDNIKFFDYAVADVNGPKSFYKIDVEKQHQIIGTRNMAAGSLFVSTGNYPEYMPQIETIVECTRLDDWARREKIDRIDIIWADLQGAELSAYKGLGNLINDVKVIYTEVLYDELYKDNCLFHQISDYLFQKGFVMLTNNVVVPGWWGDAIFINRSLRK